MCTRSEPPRLTMNLRHAEGYVEFPPRFSEVKPLTRADVLRDWIDTLTVEYLRAVNAIGAHEE